MFIKYSYEGKSMFWWAFFGFIIKIVLFVAWLMASKENAVVFIEHIEAVINDGIDISIMFLLKQAGWIFLKFVLAVVLEGIIAFGIMMPIARSIINNRTRW